MFAINPAQVNDRRTSNVDRDGFDRDLSYDESAPRMRLMPAGTTADIEIWSDTDTAAEGRTLVSRGNTFLPKKPNEVVNDNKPDEDSGTVEVHDHAPLTTTRGRYDLRHSIASMLRPDDGTRGPAVCGCGLSGHEIDDVSVHLNGNKRAYVSGVFRCDSAWLCPTCAPRRAFEIQERLTVAARACIERGGSVWFVTPTVRRIRDQPLLEMKNGFQAAWREARQGAGWSKPAKAAGILGLTNVVETPWSPVTGWGVHGHTLIFFDHCDAVRAREACELLIHRFLGRLPDHGLSGTWYAQDAEECQDAKKAATYCGKVAAELAHGWVKKGRKLSSTSVHPFALAARATMKTPDGNQIYVPGLERVSTKRCKALWREYAAAMPGTRLGVISASLAKKLGIQPANDDEEDGVQEMLEEERIGTIPAPTWNRLVRRALAGTFLSKIESKVDWDEAEAWAMEAGKEDQPGDDEYLLPDGPLERARPRRPELVARRDQGTREILTRDVAMRVYRSAATGRKYETIGLMIDGFRASGVHDGALPIASDVVAEIARLAQAA